MCRIFGTWNKDFNDIEVERLMHHGGPDGYLSVRCGNWKMAHARLSILDLSSNGTQPMQRNNNWIVFNGEIYNYKELQEDYLSDEKFISTSDTEVLLALLNKFGLKIVNQLNGMFAFAWYDSTVQTMYLVRDRYGVKPLFYYSMGSQFAFSSEMAVILKVMGLDYKINVSAAEELIKTQMMSDYNEMTFVQNIYQVQAGEYISVKNNNNTVVMEKTKWYNYDDCNYDNTDYKDYQTIIDNFEEIFVSSLMLRNRSDVPIGITLSGGLDSSLIYVLNKEKLNIKCKIFTYVNENKILNEFDKVKRLADEYGDEVITIKHQDETWESFERSLFHLEAPIWSFDQVGFYEVYKKIHQNNVKVILEGHGADELLGGWEFTMAKAYKDEFAAGHWRNGWNIFKVRLESLNPGMHYIPKNNVLNILRYFKHCFLDTQKHVGMFEENLHFYFEKMSLPINLRCFDRLSMAHSIESRSPFLDYRLVEYARKIPLVNKINAIGNKAILREIFKKYGKDYIYTNKVKQPYLGSVSDFLNANSERLLKLYDASSFKHLWTNRSTENKKEILYGISNKDLKNRSIGGLYQIIAFEWLLEKFGEMLNNESY